jgi:peptide/nickel transport system substrate-binding protein
MYKSAVVLKDQLEKIGMKVNLEVYDWPTVLSKRANDKLWNIFVTGFLITVEPSQILYLDSRFKWAGWYNNPQMDGLLDEMRQAPSVDQAKKVFEKVQALYWDDVPVIKFGNLHLFSAERNYVKGFQFFCDNHYWNISVK